MSTPLAVVSYNVLADAYIKPEFYPRVRPEHLDRRRRRRALIERIAAFDADVICLQEVEEELFRGLQSALRGLEGQFAKKAGGKPDGCATFVRGPGAVHYARAYSDGSGHVALLTALEGIAVANTHFKWGAGRGQAVELLNNLEEGTAWIVCGDFNAPPESELVEEFRRRGFVDAYAAIGGDTCNANGVAKRIDFVMHRGLTGTPVALAPIDGRTPLPSESEPSDHLAIRCILARP